MICRPTPNFGTFVHLSAPPVLVILSNLNMRKKIPEASIRTHLWCVSRLYCKLFWGNMVIDFGNHLGAHSAFFRKNNSENGFKKGPPKHGNSTLSTCPEAPREAVLRAIFSTRNNSSGMNSQKMLFEIVSRPRKLCLSWFPLQSVGKFFENIVGDLTRGQRPVELNMNKIFTFG